MPCPPPGDLPDLGILQGIIPCLLGLLYWQAGFFTTSATWEAQYLPSDACSLEFYKDGSCARWAVMSV